MENVFATKFHCQIVDGDSSFSFVDCIGELILEKGSSYRYITW